MNKGAQVPVAADGSEFARPNSSRAAGPRSGQRFCVARTILRQPNTGLAMTKALVALARTAALVMVRKVLPAATRAKAPIASVVDSKQVGRELGVALGAGRKVRKQAKKAQHARVMRIGR